MKWPVFFLLFSFVSVYVHAQSTIGDARHKTVGSEVTVSGIVTNGNEFYKIRYMQDHTGGIAVYGSEISNVNRGDSISVTGILEDFNNLLEITNVSNLTIHKSGVSLPEPKVLTIDQVGEEYESQLIRINEIHIVNAAGSFSGSNNYEFTDGNNSGELRINSSSSIVGQPIPSGSFNLVAICSQFSYTNNDTQTGYQMLPRTMDDFVSGSLVNFTSSIQVVDITKNSVVLGWSTDVGATPFVRYGSSAGSLSNYKAGNSTTSDETNWHQVEISNLQPAEIIYAQAFMVLDEDTVFSNAQAFVSQSSSTGTVNVYFNSDVDQTIADSILAMNIGDNMEDTLAAYINRAEESIDLSIYNFDNTAISNALNAAFNRGVAVRVITCGSTTHASIYDLESGIPVLERPEVQQGGIMHNKFAVFDANAADANKAWVWSGSTNLTPAQLYTDANNMIFIQDQSLAKTYEIEFEEMWGSSNETPNAANAKFGEAKTDNTPHHFIIGGRNVSCYFSPSDDTNQKLIYAINSADNNLFVETMLITRSDLSSAIIDAFDRGVNVHVLTDSESDNADYVNEGLANNLYQDMFVFDNNASGMLHHKVAIVDAEFTDSDPLVITGSHNWSSSANDRNDENTLVIHDQFIANQYLQQFSYRFGQNNGTLLVSAEVVEVPEISVYPNPTRGFLRVSSDKPLKNIQLFNLNGNKIKEWPVSNERTFELNMSSDLNQGIYILRVTGKEGDVNSYKLVKQ